MRSNSRSRIWRNDRSAVTLIELLAVIVILTMLMAMLFPAINAARESGREAACKNNLRQFGVAMFSNASRTGAYCSGAFDWNRDGCVTEVGWVADMVNAGVPVGEMLCPSNPVQVSRTFIDLLSMDPMKDACVDRLGSPRKTAPDGTLITNPCRRIATTPLDPNSEERRELVEETIFAEHYNTNYTASWWLVRSGVILDDDGNLRQKVAGCGASPEYRNTTMGPLKQNLVDSSGISSSFVPLLGCGQPTGQALPQQIGPHPAGALTVQSFTVGPVENPSMTFPGASTFPVGTPRTGTNGWWAWWTHHTLQDFRRFAPVHRNSCNLLMADGSVRNYIDGDDDYYLNNGFIASTQSGFASSNVELPREEIVSEWSLRTHQDQ